jgi:hypothetical protein
MSVFGDNLQIIDLPLIVDRRARVVVVVTSLSSVDPMAAKLIMAACTRPFPVPVPVEQNAHLRILIPTNLSHVHPTHYCLSIPPHRSRRRHPPLLQQPAPFAREGKAVFWGIWRNDSGMVKRTCVINLSMEVEVRQWYYRCGRRGKRSRGLRVRLNLFEGFPV